MRSAVIVAVMMAGLIGCGATDETQNFSLVPVTGTVTLESKPLDGAELTFSPHPNNKLNTPGTGFTDSSGNYKVMYRDRPGIAAGKYTVMISKTTLPGGSASFGSEKDPYMASLAAEGQVTSKVKPVKIEANFSTEVPGKANAYDFDVKSTSK